jgi:hypothetical protein
VEIMRGGPDFPTELRAQGGNVKIVKGDDNKFYEVHRFDYDPLFSSQSLALSKPIEKAWVLVVAGGGGGGYGGGYPSGGGGGGGVVEHTNYEFPAGSYPVIVGAGGNVGPSSLQPGDDGGDSSLGGNLFIAYGGGGGGGASGWYKDTRPGMSGGSTGGGNGGTAQIKEGIVPFRGSSYGNLGSSVYPWKPEGVKNFDSQNGGGGAGGPGISIWPYTDRICGGPGLFSDISGEDVYYAAGGTSSTAGPGNGGNAGRQKVRETAGTNGVVIVRFPAEPPKN